MNTKLKDQLKYFFVPLIIITIFLFVISNAENSSSDSFDLKFKALKSNIDLFFSKIELNDDEKSSYINNSCRLAFGDGSSRPLDVDLCKDKLNDVYSISRR